MLTAEFGIRHGPSSRAPSLLPEKGLTQGRRGGSEAMMATRRAGPLVQESRTRERQGVAGDGAMSEDNRL